MALADIARLVGVSVSPAHHCCPAFAAATKTREQEAATVPMWRRLSPSLVESLLDLGKEFWVDNRRMIILTNNPVAFRRPGPFAFGNFTGRDRVVLSGLAHVPSVRARICLVAQHLMHRGTRPALAAARRPFIVEDNGDGTE